MTREEVVTKISRMLEACEVVALSGSREWSTGEAVEHVRGATAKLVAGYLKDLSKDGGLSDG